MRISVPCHHCEQPKRPLSACPSCAAGPMAETELHAWRTSLHAYHLARITETPAPAPLPDEPEWSNEALQVVLVLDGLDSLVRHAPATIIPLEPPLHTDDALSFDWEDGGAPRRLRRSA